MSTAHYDLLVISGDLCEITQSDGSDCAEKTKTFVNSVIRKQVWYATLTRFDTKHPIAEVYRKAILERFDNAHGCNLFHWYFNWFQCWRFPFDGSKFGADAENQPHFYAGFSILAPDDVIAYTESHQCTVRFGFKDELRTLVTLRPTWQQDYGQALLPAPLPSPVAGIVSRYLHTNAVRYDELTNAVKRLVAKSQDGLLRFYNNPRVASNPRMGMSLSSGENTLEFAIWDLDPYAPLDLD